MKRIVAPFALAALALAGCSPDDGIGISGSGLSLAANLVAEGAPSTGQLFAYRHSLQMEMELESVEPRFERTRDYCLQDVELGCFLENAELNVGDSNYGATRYGVIAVTLPHDSVAIFEERLIVPLLDENPGDAIIVSRSTAAQKRHARSGRPRRARGPACRLPRPLDRTRRTRRCDGRRTDPSCPGAFGNAAGTVRRNRTPERRFAACGARTDDGDVLRASRLERDLPAAFARPQPGSRNPSREHGECDSFHDCGHSLASYSRSRILPLLLALSAGAAEIIPEIPADRTSTLGPVTARRVFPWPGT